MKMLFTPILVLLLAGCATAGYQRADRTAQSMDSARQNMAQMSESIDKTTASLRSLINREGGDLRPAFRDYSSNVQQLRAISERTIANAERMREQGLSYFREWQGQLQKIRTDELQSISQERLEAARDDYEAIRDSLWRARQAYAPYIRDLTDIERFLSVDLTPGAVERLRPTADRAINASDNVKRELQDAMNSADRVSAIFTGRERREQ